MQFKQFYQGKRVQILLAHTLDGVIYYEVYKENTDVQVVEGFLERLLPFYDRYPKPKSIIFITNASFHFFSLRIKQILSEAGVLIEYQPP